MIMNIQIAKFKFHQYQLRVFIPKLMLTTITAIMCMANELTVMQSIKSNTANSAIERWKQEAAQGTLPKASGSSKHIMASGYDPQYTHFVTSNHKKSKRRCQCRRQVPTEGMIHVIINHRYWGMVVPLHLYDLKHPIHIVIIQTCLCW